MFNVVNQDEKCKKAFYKLCGDCNWTVVVGVEKVSRHPNGFVQNDRSLRSSLCRNISGHATYNLFQKHLDKFNRN